MAAAASSKKRLALAIIDFLSTSLQDGTISSDDAESIEVAKQCIADSFKVSPDDPSAMADALGGKSLFSIYGVFEKMKERSMPAKPSTPPVGGSTTTAQTTGTTSPAAAAAASGPSEADKRNADALKTQGNAAMAKRDFAAAVGYYTQALELTPKNTIYLSNRAAAYSSLGQHEKAIEDAQVAVDEDPTYTKAWSRLGLARFAVGDARGSMEAYKAGIEAEGNGGSEIMKNGYITAKRRVEEEEEEAERAAGGTDAMRSGSPPASGAPGGMPDLASLASMFGGGRGGGAPGGGGMPDLSSIMSNPMFAQMAQNVMSNPALVENMMNNPRVREMMDSFGGGGEGRGGGMPDLGSLMSDPSIADFAKNIMGGAGGGSPGTGRGA